MADENPQNQLINLQAQQLAAQIANWAAQLEFQKERMRLLELPEMQGKLQIEIDKLAWDKAQGEWENAFKESSLTGTYKGQPTLEWLTQQAQLTGVLNGSQTLQGKLTDAQINQMNQSLKLANDEFVSNTTGYFNGQKTFDRQKFEQQQATENFRFLAEATGYLGGQATLERERFGFERERFDREQAADAWKFLSTLTGAPNAFKQARAIGTMPEGMKGIMNAWAGQYGAAGSGAVGSSGGHASLQDLALGFGGLGPNGAQDGLGGGGQLPAYAYGGAPNPYPPGYGGYIPPNMLEGPPPPLQAPPLAGGGAPLAGGGVPAGTPPPASGAPPASGLAGVDWMARAAPQGYLDDGFYVWLKNSGITPGDPALAGNVEQYRATYAGMTQAQHADYIRIGNTNPEQYQFHQGLANWAHIPGLPPSGQFQGTGGQPGANFIPLNSTQPGLPTTPPPAATPPPTAEPPYGNAPYPPEQPGEGGGGSYAPGPGEGVEGGTGGWAPINAGERPPEGVSIDAWLKARQGDQQGYWGQDAQGQFIFTPSGTATARPEAMSAQSQMPAYSYQASGVQAPVQAWNYSPNMSGSMAVYPPGTASPWDTPDISTQYPISPQMAGNMYSFGGFQQQQQQPQQQRSSGAWTNPWYSPQQSQYTAPAQTGQTHLLPNQIDAKNYAKSFDYQKELGWAQFEDQGWDPGLAKQAFERSLPTYGGPKRGNFAF